jgi:ketosteroid isomerase-like protein
MSSNAELIGNALDHISRAEIPQLLEMLDPEIEWRPPAQGTLDRVYKGHDGVQKLFDQLYEAWETIEHKPIKLVEGGNNSVVVTHVKLHGRTSGLDMDEVWAYVLDIRDGKFVHVAMYTDPAEAVKAHTSDVLASAPAWPEDL